ncbi:MAG: recombinase [Rubrivivax sp.]|nr:recombinase [Rubrivivax sp.]
MAAWDLTALLNAADPKAGLADRHIWLVRLMEWLRHAPPPKGLQTGEATDASSAPTPRPIVKLRHLLAVLDANPAHRERVQGLLGAFWREIDAAALFADFGFSSRLALRSEVTSRIRQRLLPRSPETRDLAELFHLVFDPRDAAWVDALDEPLLARIAELLLPGAEPWDWRGVMLDAITILVSAIHAAGFAPPLRKRMSPALLADEPFRQLPHAADRLRLSVQGGDAAQALAEARYLRALLDACRRASASITEHLEEHGVSVDIVFEMDQLRSRCERVELLLQCVLSPKPASELRHLVAELVRVEGHLLGLRDLLARHYSLLARQVAERSAETGERYITRDRDEYRDMLRRAAGGGAVIAGTTFVKFAIAALGLSAFWTGFWSGANYAASFVLIMLLHWTVATKQPAMTAPAMAARLQVSGANRSDAEIEAFVDRVAALIRSQVAGIAGNLALCAPLVLAAQWIAAWAFGAPLVGTEHAPYILDSLTLLGPTALFAAFTGVLLFASSLVAGWAENWFVFHRLDSAIAHNPRIVVRLGAPRAARWAAWWRRNVSGLAANVSLGMMLGLVPALLGFVGLPIEVRHVTLSTGQVAAALGAEGLALLTAPVFWWCVAGIAATGVLNVTVSFWLAFKVALRSRGVRVRDRSRIGQALRRRLRSRPLSFLWPPREAAVATTDGTGR